MSTVCEFSARRVRRSFDTIVDSNSSLQFTRRPVADPIATAVNNVRFGCTGFASRPFPGFLEVVLLDVVSKATFRFRPDQASRFIANAHFVPTGVFSLTARAGGFLQSPGFARFAIFARVVTRVRAASGETVFNFATDFQSLFDFDAEGTDVAVTTSGVVSAEFGSLFISTPVSPVFVPSDTIFVRAEYQVQVIATNGAEFLIDFDTGAGLGLNVPLVAVNFLT